MISKTGNLPTATTLLFPSLVELARLTCVNVDKFCAIETITSSGRSGIFARLNLESAARFPRFTSDSVKKKVIL